MGNTGREIGYQCLERSTAEVGNEMHPHTPPSFLEVAHIGRGGMSVERSTPERPDRPDPMGGEKISNARVARARLRIQSSQQPPFPRV